MYRILRKLHLWLAVPFGLVFFMSCLTGAILIILDMSGEHPAVVLRLHRWLMDVPAQRGAMTPGKMIVGISTLASVAVLISGIFLWWPRGKAGLKRSLSLVAGKGAFSFWRSTHVAGGMYIVLFVTVMALTGLTWSYGWYRNIFYSLFGGDNPEALRGVIYGLHTGKTGGVATQIIWLLSCLIAASLPLSGYWMWFRRTRKRPKLGTRCF